MLRKFSVFLILIIVLQACSKKNEEPVLDIVKPVKYIKLQSNDFGQKFTFAGEIKSKFESTLSFKVGGSIEKIYFNPGEKILKNQLISELDDTDYKLKYSEIKSKLISIKEGHKATESTFKRFTKLYENNNISLQDLEEIQAKFKSEKNQIKSIENALSILQKQIEYTKLYAPENGTISKKIKEEKENIDANKPFITFINPDELEAVIYVPENMINNINIGDQAKIKLWSSENALFNGVVVEKQIDADPYTKTFEVKIKVNNVNQQKIKAGMSCEIIYEIIENSDKDKFTIPIASVFAGNDSKKSFVWKYDSESQKIKKIQVIVDRIVPNGIRIIGGLKENDIIVTAGTHFLVENQKVRLLEPGKLY
jgi:multidrug efflux system membrane fusion protein